MQNYLQLIQSSFQHREQNDTSGTVVAFTSTNAGEGVSYAVQSCGAELARFTGRRTLIATSTALQDLQSIDFARMPAHCVRTNVPNLWILPGDEYCGGRHRDEAPMVLVESWRGDPEFGRNRIRALKESFDQVLIDCPALQVSADALMLSPMVDGVVMVVEANRTKREQVNYALQNLERSTANVLGLVLNKRRYPLPNWLNNMV